MVRHQYGILAAESQTFLLAKRPQRPRARRNGCFRRLVLSHNEISSRERDISKSTHYHLTSFPPCAKAPKAAVKICKNAKSLPVLGSSVTCFLASISNDIPRDLARSICASLGPVPFCSLLSISTLESLGDEDEERRSVGSGNGGTGADSSDRTVNVTSSCSSWLDSSSGSFVSLESGV